MYAVFRTGGKQYRARKGDRLRVERLDAEEGATVKFEQVLLIGEGTDIQLGSPILSGGCVEAKVTEQGTRQEGCRPEIQAPQELQARQGPSAAFYRGRGHVDYDCGAEESGEDWV